MTGPRLLRLDEAAPLLGYPTPHALYLAIRRGDIPGRKLSGRWRVRSIDIDALVGDVVEPARTDRPRHLIPVEPDEHQQVSA